VATIIKLKRRSGFVYKAIIKDKKGRLLKTKTMQYKTELLQWVKENEDNFRKVGTRWRNITLSQLIIEYLAEWDGKDHTNQGRINWWSDRLGHRKLATISTEDVAGYLNAYRSTVSNGTHNRMKSCLSALFRFAKKQGYTGINPVTDTPSYKEARNRIRYLSDKERLSLLKACRELDAVSEWGKLTLLVTMALMTGARRGELLKLSWRDIDFTNRTAILKDTKNGTDRMVSFPLPILELMIKHRGNNDALIFSANCSNKPFVFRKHWVKALSNAGVTEFRFHDLRHTCASYLANAGASAPDIQAVLGHKSYETTRKYVHLSSERVQSVTDSVFEKLVM